MRDSLAAIRRDILSNPSCPLARLGRRAVPGEGPEDATIFVIGQAPGAEEDRTGRPFVGRAGRFLTQALRRIGCSRDTCFITSIEKHFPPHHRLPTRREIAACLPFLRRQLAVVQPRIVILLGRLAQKVLSGDPLLKGRRVIALPHPAAAMRFPDLRLVFLRRLRLHLSA